MHDDRMGYGPATAGGEAVAVLDSMVKLERHDGAIVFSCLEGKTLARLLLMLGECPGGSVPVRPVPVDVVEVGRTGETPSLAPGRNVE